MTVEEKSGTPSVADDEKLTVKQACVVIGGSEHPIHEATYWRGAKKGIWPLPVMLCDNVARVLKSELAEALNKRVADRDAGTQPRGNRLRGRHQVA